MVFSDYFDTTWFFHEFIGCFIVVKKIFFFFSNKIAPIFGLKTKPFYNEMKYYLSWSGKNIRLDME